MSRAVLPTAFTPSISPGASPCTFSNAPLHSILGVVRTVIPRGRIKWLQRVTKRSPRTVKYWLSGKYQPGADDALKIVAALREHIEAQRNVLQQFELDLR